jgi:hypothetical protein
VAVVLGCGDNNVAAVDTPPLEPDAFVKLDAAVDAPPAPETITLSGRAVERTLAGSTPTAGVLIEAFSNANETTPLTSTTTDAEGDFSITVTTGGLAISGFLKASKVGLVDTYLYPATFIDADIAMVPIQLVNLANFEALSNLSQGGQDPGKGMIALQVLSAMPTGEPVGDVVVTSNPASTVRYNSNQGVPNAQATDTHTDGVAYIFDLPPNGSVDVMATKVGSTFATTSLKAWPDSLTTTWIQPP